MRLLVLLIIYAATLTAEMRVGRAAVKITPPEGMPMAGYYSTRLATGVHDDLWAKSIVIEDGEIKAALVSCDAIALSPGVIEEARKLIAKQSAIPATHVMISATHTHTGPVITGRSTREAAYGGDLEITKRYMADLPAKIAESVQRATQNLTPVRVSAAHGSEATIAFNRRFFMKDGSVGWNPGKLNPNIVKVAGPIDPDVGVVYFESANNEPLATYVNYAMHLDTVGGLAFSADYPFTLSSLLSKIKGQDMLTLFTLGAAGNINHIDVSTKTPQKGHNEAERLGTILAGEVIKTYARLRPVAGKLQARSVTIPLALNEEVPPTNTEFLKTVQSYKAQDVAARNGAPFEAEVQVIALGNQIAWVALPGEVFVELGLAIKQASPFPFTIVVELAHGPATYIPNEIAYKQGNYEPVSSRVAPGSGERLVSAALQLLKDLH